MHRTVLWATEGRQGDNAAIVAAGESWLLLTSDAALIVARSNAKGFEPFQRYTVANSPTWAHPVIVGSRILIKDAEKLVLWSLE